MQCPGVKRGDGVISALLYAAHALSVPVRLGVDRIARSQAFFWSVRHSLAGLECAVLLSKWLASLDASTLGAAAPLTGMFCPNLYGPYRISLAHVKGRALGSEERILHWVRCIVEEAYDVVDFDESEAEAETEQQLNVDPQGLSLAVLKIWAHFFKSNTQWPFINIIGASLEHYREMLLRGNGQKPLPSSTA